MSTTYAISEGAPVVAPTFTASATPGGFIGDATKLTLANASYAVVTNAANQLSTVQFIPYSMGGLGANPTGVVGVLASNGSNLLGVSYLTTATNNSIVLRDGSANIAAAGITGTSIVGSTSVTAPNINATSALYLSISATAQLSILGSSLQTTNATTTTLATIPTTSTATAGAKGTSYNITCEIALGDASAEVNTGIYNFIFKAKNVSGTVTVSSVSASTSALDGALSSTAYSISSSGTNILIQVTGLANVNINWCGTYRITQVIF